jgi:hypothetical protein
MKPTVCFLKTKKKNISNCSHGGKYTSQDRLDVFRSGYSDHDCVLSITNNTKGNHLCVIMREEGPWCTNALLHLQTESKKYSVICA